jgi:hypothetical protein
MHGKQKYGLPLEIFKQLNKATGKVTELFLLLAFTGLDYERYGSHAYRTEQR